MSLRAATWTELFASASGALNGDPIAATRCVALLVDIVAEAERDAAARRDAGQTSAVERALGPYRAGRHWLAEAHRRAGAGETTSRELWAAKRSFINALGEHDAHGNDALLGAQIRAEIGTCDALLADDDGHKHWLELAYMEALPLLNDPGIHTRSEIADFLAAVSERLRAIDSKLPRLEPTSFFSEWARPTVRDPAPEAAEDESWMTRSRNDEIGMMGLGP